MKSISQKVVYSLLVLFILGIITFLFIQENQENYTALSFVNPEELPQKGTDISFEVLVESHEKEQKSYTYAISLVYYSDESILLERETLKEQVFQLDPGESIVFHENLTLSNYQHAKIIVNMDQQEIYFWLEAQ